jgi:hypothetical protein
MSVLPLYDKNTNVNTKFGIIEIIPAENGTIFEKMQYKVIGINWLYVFFVGKQL